MNDHRNKTNPRPYLTGKAGDSFGSFTRPGPAIPCRVAPQQSPTPFHRAHEVYHELLVPTADKQSALKRRENKTWGLTKANSS